MTGPFVIEGLASHHDRTGFSSGTEPLDRYFRQQVTQDIRRRLTNCFVATAPDRTVAAFYTFAATSLPLAELPADQAKHLPHYPLLPAGLIGRLAVDQRFRGQGIGSILIVDAVARSVRAEPAVFALLVDAKDDAAARFYLHHGFTQLSSRPATLYLPVARAAQRLSSRHQAG